MLKPGTRLATAEDLLNMGLSDDHWRGFRDAAIKNGGHWDIDDLPGAKGLNWKRNGHQEGHGVLRITVDVIDAYLDPSIRVESIIGGSPKDVDGMEP